MSTTDALPVVAWSGNGTFISDAVKRTSRQWFASQYPTPLCTVESARAALAAQAEAHKAEVERYKSTMIAAAEEIHAHWDAHCDAEGYGPQNLQRRLEEGIPAGYGYTAGAFATLTAERDALRSERDALKADAEQWRRWTLLNTPAARTGDKA